MCLAIIKRNSQNTLIIFFRDEYVDRDFLPMNFDPVTSLFFAKDLSKNGTWLALNKKGCFAFVTNIAGGKTLSAEVESRGTIPINVLMGGHNNTQKYNSFNLIYGDNKRVYYQTNVGEKQVLKQNLITISSDVNTFRLNQLRVFIDGICIDIKAEDIMEQATHFPMSLLIPYSKDKRWCTVCTTIVLIKKNDIHVHEICHITKSASRIFIDKLSGNFDLKRSSN